MLFKNLSISSILLWSNIIQILKFIFMLVLCSLCIFIIFYGEDFKWLLDTPLLLLYFSLALNIGFFSLFFLENLLEDALFTKNHDIEVLLEEEM